MFYRLCFLALYMYILFNAYMCFLSFTNFNLHGSALYGATTGCYRDRSVQLTSSCALSSLYKAPDARVAASSLDPGACR